MFDKSRYLVDALIHSLVAYALRTIEFSGFRMERQFQGQRQRIGIITCMRSRMGYRALILHAPLFQTLGCKSGRGYRHIKDFGDGCTDSSFVGCGIAQGHIIGNDASLTVCRIGQIVEPRFSGQRMGIFNGIAHSIDVFYGSFQVLVYPDTARFAQLQTCLLRQCRCRTYTDRKQYYIGRNRFSAFQKNGNSLFSTPETGNALFQIKGNAFFDQMPVNRCSHGEVDRRHNLIAHLYNRNRNARMMQVFRHLKSDEACAYYNCAFYLLVCDISLNPVGIFYIAKRKDTFRVNAFQRRFHRIGSRRKQKFVIGFFIFLSICFTDSQCFLFRIDCDYFVLYPHIDTETFTE